MELIEQNVEVVDCGITGIEFLKKIENAGRTCYKSEAKITEDSAIRFVKNIINLGHESVLEHHNITLKFITDRGVTHEIVRHRLASYSQESTRYVNYGKVGLRFILPVDFELDNADLYLLALMEEHYLYCLQKGRTPQQARYFLPNGTKTEIVMTANIREWRHFFKLRCSKAAHPQIRALTITALCVLKDLFPVVFDDIEGEDNA